jgi:hypothetical protein
MEIDVVEEASCRKSGRTIEAQARIHPRYETKGSKAPALHFASQCACLVQISRSCQLFLILRSGISMRKLATALSLAASTALVSPRVAAIRITTHRPHRPPGHSRQACSSRMAALHRNKVIPQREAPRRQNRCGAFYCRTTRLLSGGARMSRTTAPVTPKVLSGKTYPRERPRNSRLLPAFVSRLHTEPTL